MATLRAQALAKPAFLQSLPTLSPTLNCQTILPILESWLILPTQLLASFPLSNCLHHRPTTIDESKGFAKTKAETFEVKTLLIGPYTPLHLYSAVLPINTLKLPNWSLDAAMKNMSEPFLSQTHNVRANTNMILPQQPHSLLLVRC
jgi:hypothetical protein